MIAEGTEIRFYICGGKVGVYSGFSLVETTMRCGTNREMSIVKIVQNVDVTRAPL